MSGLRKQMIRDLELAGLVEGTGEPVVYLYRAPLVVNSALEKGKPPMLRKGEIEVIALLAGTNFEKERRQ